VASNKPMNRGFATSVIEKLRHKVDAIIEDLLGSMHGESADLIKDCAYPLPVRVICELLGLPEVARPLRRPIQRHCGLVRRRSPPGGVGTRGAYPHLSLIDDAPGWGANSALRGLNSLRVRPGPAA